MKKVIALASVFAILFGFTGCTDTSAPSESPNGVTAAVSADASPDTSSGSDEEILPPPSIVPSAEPTEEEDLNEYHVKILDSRKELDSNGNEAIIISFEYTNNDSENEAFEYSIFPRAYQGGQELEVAYVLGSDDNSIDAAIQEIAPGETITVDRGFVLLDNSPVELNVTGYAYSGETNLTKIFTLD